MRYSKTYRNTDIEIRSDLTRFFLYVDNEELDFCDRHKLFGKSVLNGVSNRKDTIKVVINHKPVLNNATIFFNDEEIDFFEFII